MQRMYPNEKFMATALEKVTSFIKLGVLPELLGKWYSKAPVSSGMGCRDLHQSEDISSQSSSSSSHEKVWCYSKQEEEGEMIACDHEQCSIMWFHAACLQITSIPKGKWYCPDRRKIVKKGKNRHRLLKL